MLMKIPYEKDYTTIEKERLSFILRVGMRLNDWQQTDVFYLILLNIHVERMIARGQTSNTICEDFNS